MHAEPTVMSLRVHSRKLSAVHVYERGVVTAFDINIGLRVDAIVNDNLERVAFPDRRYSTTSTVAEELRNLVALKMHAWSDDVVGWLIS